MMLRFSKFDMLLLIAKLLATKNVKCISLSNQPYIAGTTPINLNPTKLRYFSVVIRLYKCGGVCVSNKTKDVNFKVFNMITKQMNQDYP